MKRFKFLYAFLAATLCYVLFTVTAGSDGIFAERQLREQKRILSARTEKIQNINDSLNLECTALKNDLEVIGGLAHKLGFVSENEKIVKINGLSFEGSKLYDAGTPIKAKNPQFIPEWFGKALSLFTFVFVYVFLLIKDIRAGLYRRNKTVFMEGIPVYDLPQI